MALIQQVMEMSERLRQSEEAAEQARKLLEAHRSAGQILEELMTRAEAAATAETLSAGGMRPRQGPRCQKHQELMTGDSDFESWRRDINERASAARALLGETGPGFFRTWAGRFQRGRVQEVIRAVAPRPGEEAHCN